MNNSMTDENKWANLHLHLQDLLAGYVDDELDQQKKLLIEAHLAGCESCRADVARQQLISQRLKTLPPERLSPEIHREIDDALSVASLPSEDNKHQAQQIPIFIRCYHRFCKPRLLAASGWGIALLLIVVLLYPSLKPENNQGIPMVEDVLAKYLQLNKTALPVSNNLSTSPLPANWPHAHLLSSWETTVGGAPAKAFAMRNGDNIILQYRIDETVFFRNPVVRKAIADSGSYLSQKNNIQVLAMPLKGAGLLVVGPADNFPPAEKITLVKT